MLTAKIVDTVRFRGADWPSAIEVVDAERGSVVLFEKVRGVKCANKECGRRHLWWCEGASAAVCSSCSVATLIVEDGENEVDDAATEAMAGYGEAIYRCVAAHVNATMRKGTIADHEAGVKVCAKCRVAKPLAEFGVNTRRMDGFMIWCKACAPKPKRAKPKRAKPKSVGVGDETLYIKQPKHGIPGVVYIGGRRSKPWKGEYTIEGKKKYFGCYATAVEAGLAVFDAVKELTGVDLWEHWTPRLPDDIDKMERMLMRKMQENK